MSDKTPGDPISDQLTFENLYKEVHDPLVANLTGMVRDLDRAEDIAATAFQRAWEKRAQFRGESSLGTWLHAIGRNAARHSWRQERTSRLDPVDRLDTVHHAEPDRMFARLERDVLRTRVRTALARIPAHYRRLLIDRYIDGRSVREIARRARVPVGTVGSRLFAARRMLRESWAGAALQRVGREMPQEKAQSIAEEALKRLTEEMQAGRSEVLTAYLAAMGRFHRYSWNNVMLIQSQRPTATHVAGFHTWHGLGRSVKGGEKGIAILAPIRTRQVESTAPRDPTHAENTTRVVGFRTAYVFDVEQTEGRSLPAFAATTGEPRECMNRLKAFVAERGIALEYDPSIAPAQGVSSGGRIRLLPGMAPGEEFSVLTHELAHEMLHQGRDVSLSKTVRETQAEAVAFVVCRGIGLETHTAAADYIALYNGDAKTLAESLSAIQGAASRILKDLLPEDRVPEAPENTLDTEPRSPTAPQALREEALSSDRPAAPLPSERAEPPSWDR